jgi:tight adherence protein C
MLGTLFHSLINLEIIFSLVVAVATAATIYVIAAPIFVSDVLSLRIKSVADERERIRKREREQLQNDRSMLRGQQNVTLKKIVAWFNLKKLVGADEDKVRLAQAGFRSPSTQHIFLISRMACPIGFLLFGGLYLYVVLPENYAITTKVGAVLFVGYIGFKLPDIWLSNRTQKRQLSIRRAFPDALDLMVICVESGMPIEQAFKRISEEIGRQSIPLAEELMITTAELSYLPNRRLPYENFSLRTGVEDVRSIVTVLIQAENYGTPLGTALRVVSQEARETRMMQAEKKAAALPPMLTVPMILFFLPILFAVILTPAFIQIGKNNL